MATKEQKLKNLELIASVFKKHKVRFLVVYGALLGWHRDKDFLPGDDDIDLAVIDPVDFKTRKAIGWQLYYLGFETQTLGFTVPNASNNEQLEPAEIGYNGTENTGIIVCQKDIKFTIFFFGQPEPCEKHGEDIVCVPKLGALKLISSPARFYKKPGEIKIGKQKYLCPGPIEDYLAFTYFDNWKDKTDRRHGDTYWVMHNENPFVEDVDKKNEVVIYK